MIRVVNQLHNQSSNFTKVMRGLILTAKNTMQYIEKEEWPE